MFRRIATISLSVISVFLFTLLSTPYAHAANTISIFTPSSGAQITGSEFVTSGTATANSRITVKVNGVSVGTTTSNASGNWSLVVTNQAAGAKTVEATASTQLYYANSINIGTPASSLMYKINTLDNSVVGTFVTSGGGFPFFLWQPNTDFTKAYGVLPQLSSPDVSVVDLVNESVTQFTMSGTSPVPADAAFNADDTRVYIGDSANDVVQIYNTSTNASTGTVALSDSPSVLTKRPFSNQIWVATTSAIEVIDTQTNTVIDTYGAGTTYGNLIFSSDGSRAYITVGNEVRVFDADDGTLLDTLTTSGGSFIGGLAINDAGTRFYASQSDSNAVDVFDLQTSSIVATITVQSGPVSVILAESESKLYVTNPNLSGGANGTTISVINTTNNTVEDTLTTSGAPFIGHLAPMQTATASVSFAITDSSLANTGTNMRAILLIAGGLVLSGLGGLGIRRLKHLPQKYSG